jgi:hypothetical protein
LQGRDDAGDFNGVLAAANGAKFNERLALKGDAGCA